mmetsp:Transcript_23959/g.18282  ORF Transcript_23959/g.18282 Transcript_23959/m.18282 type:complete len:117 (+) Transcript_23959:379-729(+)
MKDDRKHFEAQQLKKLLAKVKDEVRKFCDVVVNTLVLFYQLDIKHGEDSIGCLHSMIMTLVLKNPIYSSLVLLMKKAMRDDIQRLEENIGKIVELYDVEKDLGVDQIELGKNVCFS